MTVARSDIPVPHPAASASPGSAASPRAIPGTIGNPLKDLAAHGKMPVVFEMHLTEGDRAGFHALRQRCLADNLPLSQFTLLGQYLRQLDMSAAGLSAAEKALAVKLQSYADLIGTGRVDLIALDDGARGRDTLDNAIVAELLAGLGVDPARIMANIVARNRRPDQLRRRLAHFASLGVRNVLLLTGDLPAEPGKTAVFPMDSIGLCAMARSMVVNGELPGDFVIAAAGHPGPDADPDGLRTLHKALAGARLIVTQAVHSAEEFAVWMRSLRGLGVLDMADVLAEVVPISSARQLRVVAEVPGMRVPDELIREMESLEERIASAAVSGGHDDAWRRDRLRHEGTRLTRTLLHALRRVPGVSGFYLGCVKGFEAHLELLKETPLVAEERPEATRGVKLSGPMHQRAIAEQPRVEAFLDHLRERSARRRRGKLARLVANAARSKAFERALRVLEAPKIPLFGCKQCDRCDLSPDALICPRGCAKQMTHGPCGAPRRVGDRVLCEDRSRECTWADILRRRDELGVPVWQRLAVREAPSPEFYEGRRYSAFLPVLMGDRDGPSWSLGPKAAVAGLARRLGRPRRFASDGGALDLLTLVRSKREELLRLLSDKPEMDREELLVKALALVGTPAALRIVESILVRLGMPAEGALHDLSMREQFRLAEALPMMRRQTSAPGDQDAGTPAVARCESLLAAVPEGRELRRAMRRELAGAMIRHLDALGVRVGYSDTLLEGKFVEDFLPVLAAFKDEVQLAFGGRSVNEIRLSAQFDRAHYKHHYRPPIAIRWFHDSAERRLGSVELAIDLKQHRSVGAFRLALRDAMDLATRGADESDGAIHLEPFCDESRSVCWVLNRAYWQRLRDFEEGTGVKYDASIGGSTDHNLAYVRSTARAFFDRLHENRLDGDEWFVVEIGVASPLRAKAFLDEFRRVCELNHASHHERVTYVLADFSEAILERSVRELSGAGARVVGVRMDLANPAASLAPYRGRVMHAHLCNVFDNLPADRLAWIDDRMRRVEVRAYLPRDALKQFLAAHRLTESDGAALVSHLTTLRDTGSAGVECMLSWFQERLAACGRPALDYVRLWIDLFQRLRFAERYVDLPETQTPDHSANGGIRDLASLAGAALDGTRNVHVHVSEAAMTGFIDLLDVLHPHGILEIVDLFTQRVEEYAYRFMGPAKYDGSTVNWLLGPLFRAVGERRGHRVRFNLFKPFDPKSVSVILLAGPSARPLDSQSESD